MLPTLLVQRKTNMNNEAMPHHNSQCPAEQAATDTLAQAPNEQPFGFNPDPTVRAQETKIYDDAPLKAQDFYGGAFSKEAANSARQTKRDSLPAYVNKTDRLVPRLLACYDN